MKVIETPKQPDKRQTDEREQPERVEMSKVWEKREELSMRWFTENIPGEAEISKIMGC